MQETMSSNAIIKIVDHNLVAPRMPQHFFVVIDVVIWFLINCNGNIIPLMK